MCLSLNGNITKFTHLPHAEETRHGDKRQGLKLKGVNLAWCYCEKGLHTALTMVSHTHTQTTMQT